MHHRTTKEILTKSVRGLCSDFPVLPAAESRHVDAGRMLARTGSHRPNPRHYHRRLACLQAFSQFGKMVAVAIKRSGLMKQQIERIAWREMVWNRPFSLQDVYAALLHLASLTPRGAVVFEIRGGNGKIRYFLGADSLYIHRVENVFQTQGQVQFADLPPEARQGTYAARQLKISHPVLSLNTDTTQAAIRAALAAMAGCKSSMVVQVVFGR